MIREDSATDFTSLEKRFERSGQKKSFDIVAYSMQSATSNVLLASNKKVVSSGDIEGLFNKAVKGIDERIAGVNTNPTKRDLYDASVALYNNLTPNEREIIFKEKLPDAVREAGAELDI